MEMASGTKIMTNAMVSSLMPNTAPNKLNINIIREMMMFSTPNLRNSLYLFSFNTLRRKDITPTSIAWLLLRIQNAPPTIKMKIIMSALSTNPSNNAENTCQV